MPPRYPKKDNRFLAWARGVTRVWTGQEPGGGGQVPDIGLTEAQAQRAFDLFEAAFQRHREQIAAAQAARAATAAKRLAFARLKAELGADIGAITAYATITGDRGVYTRARIWKRRRASRQRPVAPSNLRFAMPAGGAAVELAWDGRTLPGTAYVVRRQVLSACSADARPAGTRPIAPHTDHSTEPAFEYLATVTQRRFVDQTIPPGAARAVYAVHALKGREETAPVLAGVVLHGLGDPQDVRAGTARAA